jgi:hypothetical protein
MQKWLDHAPRRFWTPALTVLARFWLLLSRSSGRHEKLF